MEKLLSQNPVNIGSIIVGLEKCTNFSSYNKKEESMIKRMFFVEEMNRKIDRRDVNITHSVSIARTDGLGNRYLLTGEADGDKIRIRMDQPIKNLNQDRNVEQDSLVSYSVTEKTLNGKELKYVKLTQEIEKNQRKYVDSVKQLGEARLSDDEAGILQRKIKEELENLQSLNWNTHMILKELSDLNIPSPEITYNKYIGIKAGMIILTKDKDTMLVLEKNSKPVLKAIDENNKSSRQGDTFTCIDLNGIEKNVFTSQNHQLNQDTSIMVINATEKTKADITRIMVENMNIKKLSKERMDIMKNASLDPHLCEIVKKNVLSLKEQMDEHIMRIGINPATINMSNCDELKLKTNDVNTAGLIAQYPQTAEKLDDIVKEANKTIATYGLDKDYGAGDITVQPQKEKPQSMILGEKPEKANNLSELLDRATASVGKKKGETKEISKNIGKGILKGS